MNTRAAAISPEAVRSLLHDLQVHDLHVAVVGGEVTLTGVAPCYNTKHAATARIQDALPGVLVINELRVGQHSGGEHALAAIVRDAVRASAGADVHVDVRDDCVTVRGAARDETMRRRIEAAAWEAAAGFNVHTEIATGPALDDPAIEAGLAEYVRRAMAAAARDITLTYRAGVVTLNGAVTSRAQGQAIEDLLRWHDRVDDVINVLQVAPANAGTAAGMAS